MPFIDEILKYKSLSIVGLEKNTGKTESLNYILGRLRQKNVAVALTSIGIDGESRDQVCQTPKPEIEVYEGMIFITSEKHYHERRITSEILDVSQSYTSLGRLVTARAISSDKVLISGPPDTNGLKLLIRKMEQYNVDLTIVDGALSRLSLGSPAVTEATVLATGAALSANIPELVRRTKFIHDLIELPEVSSTLKEKLDAIEKGVFAIDKDENLHNLGIQSVLMVDNVKDKLLSHGHHLFIAGATSEKLFNFLRMQKAVSETILVVKDFTKIFTPPEAYYAYIKKGGRVMVAQKTKLAAVCINPVSPKGYTLNSNELKKAMQESLNIPVYDVKML